MADAIAVIIILTVCAIAFVVGCMRDNADNAKRRRDNAVWRRMMARDKARIQYLNAIRAAEPAAERAAEGRRAWAAVRTADVDSWEPRTLDSALAERMAERGRRVFGD